MGILSRLVSAFATKAADPGSNVMLSLPMFGGAARRGTAELIAMYNSNPTLRMIASKIALSVAAAGWRVYRRNGQGVRDLQTFKGVFASPERVRRKVMWELRASKELIEVVDHPFQVVMRKPNPFMLGFQMIAVVQTWLDIKSEAFVVKERQAGPGSTVVALWPVPPSWVTQVPDGDKYTTFRISYGSWRETIPAEDMMWLRELNPSDPYGRPSGFGDALATEFDTEEAAAEYAKAFFRNYGRPAALVTLKGVTKQKMIDDAQEHWDNLNRGPGRGHRTHFAGGDVDVHEFGEGFKDASVSDLRGSVRDIAMQTWGISPEIFGKLESSNRATITAAMRFYSSTVVSPRLEFLRAMFQDQLVNEYDERSLLDYDNPIPEDREFRLEVAKTAPWAITLNEWREIGEWQPVDNGEVRFIPFTSFAVGAEEDLTKIMSVGADEPATDPATAPPSDGGQTQDVQATALNGAQIEALIGVLVAVAMGNLPRESGIGILMIAFQLTQEQAEAVMGDIGLTFTIAPPSDPPPAPDVEATNVEASKSLMARCLRNALFKAKVWKTWMAEPLAQCERRTVRISGLDIEAAISALRAERITSEINPIWADEAAEWGADALEAVGFKGSFDMLNPFLKDHIEELDLDRIKGLVDRTTKEELRVTMAEGAIKGESSEQIAARVESVFDQADRVRARVIARTEVGRSANFANRTAWTVSGVVESREWIATADDRTRDDHAEMDGETLPMDQRWEIDGATADYPGNFGVPEQDINCRCAEAPKVANVDDIDDEEIDELLEDDDRCAHLRLARAVTRMTKEQRVRYWGNMQQQLMPWENKATRAFKRGFAKQREDVLAVIRKRT